MGLEVNKIQVENPDSVIIVVAHVGHIHGLYSQAVPTSEDAHKNTIPYFSTQFGSTKESISLTTIIEPKLYPEGELRQFTAYHPWFTLPTAHSARDYVKDFYIGEMPVLGK